MASNNAVHAAVQACVRCLDGISNPLERLPTTVGTTVPLGKFTRVEVELITRLATRQIMASAIEEAARLDPLVSS